MEIEPFNLRTENKEGYFDLDGNYVEKKMQKGVKDAWLDEYDEKWAKKVCKHTKYVASIKLFPHGNLNNYYYNLI